MTWPESGGNEGGAVFGNTVYFPHTYINGETQNTILTRINATSLQTTVIPFDYSSVNYMRCDIDGDGTPDDLSVNNDMTLSADRSTATYREVG